MTLDVTEQVITEYIRNDESCILVAEENNEIIGMMILEIIPCHMVLSSHKKIGYIAAGYVKEKYLIKTIFKRREDEYEKSNTWISCNTRIMW